MTIKRTLPIQDSITRADYYRLREGDNDKAVTTRKKKQKEELDV